MADETTQTGEDTSWWAFDAFADSELPPTTFDEPLAWPDTLDWGEFAASDGDLQFPSIDDLGADPVVPATAPPPPAPAPAPPAAQPVAEGDGDPTMPHVTVLSGLGGSAASSVPARERLPDSLWAAGPAGAANGNGTAKGSGGAPVVTTPVAAAPFYGEPDRGWRQRFDLRHGNAAVIALISFVSLVLLGMFMSVRARNDVPDTSQTQTTSPLIAVQGPLNTIPLTTTVTTTAPAPINIAELVPPVDDATTVAAGSGAGARAAGAGGGATATTAAPARSAPAGGGGSSTATTQPPATEPTTATTAAPQATTQPQTTASSTPPPVDQTSPSTPRRTTPFPTIGSTAPGNDGPPRTVPSIPGITFPNF